MRRSWIDDRSFRKIAKQRTKSQLASLNAENFDPSTSFEPHSESPPYHQMEFDNLEADLMRSGRIDNLNDDEKSDVSFDLINGYQDINEFLREWAIYYKLRRAALEDLLRFLKKTTFFPDLPVTKNALLKSPTEPAPIIKVNPGEYVHIGLKAFAAELSQKIDLESRFRDNNVLHCHMHVDGISFANSSRLSGWTILVDIVEIPEVEPSLIGVYSGYHSPNDFDIFMNSICMDFAESSMNGTDTGKNFKVHFKLVVMPLDAPARSKCTHTKGHAGYYGCPFCSQKGSRIEESNAMQYSTSIEYPLRDMAAYSARVDQKHFHPSHKNKIGALETIPDFDCVTGLPPDIMHCGDLGVMLKMLKKIFSGGDKLGVRISKEMIEAINLSYLEVDIFKPAEFPRRPRNLIENINHLKATEGRHIGLYYGMKILRELPTEMYDHFLKFSLGIRLLSTSTVSEDALLVGEKLLNGFVQDFTKFYGHNLSYVVHLLLHLSYFVRLHGPLYSFSTYRFENKLASIKGDVRKKYQVSQQLYRRAKERGIVQLKKPRITGLSKASSGDFLEYYFDTFCFKTDKKGDSFAKISINNHVFPARIRGFFERQEGIYFHYQKISQVQSYFEIELEGSILSSKAFDIWKISNDSYEHDAYETANINTIIGKYVVFEDLDATIIVIFLHNMRD